jgi:hypothetical protein
LYSIFPEEMMALKLRRKHHLSNLVPMRLLISALFLAATLTGCHSPSPAPAQQTKVPAKATGTIPFSPTLITTLGTNTSPDGSWRVAVFEDALDLSRCHNCDSTGSTWLTVGWSEKPDHGKAVWTSRPGWFVFIEDLTRIWAYDGDRLLVLHTFLSEGVHATGTTYFAGYPCPVPPEVFFRLSASKQKSLVAPKP